MSFYLITLGVGEVMKGQALTPTPHPHSNISSGDALIQLITLVVKTAGRQQFYWALGLQGTK